MKKSYLILSILLLLASGVAFAFAFDRFSSAGRYFQLMDRNMERINQETDMEKLETARFQMGLDADMASKAKNLGLIGAGGGLILLFASVVLFIKRK